MAFLPFGPIARIVLINGPFELAPEAFLRQYADFLWHFAGRPLEVYLVDSSIVEGDRYPAVLELIADPEIPPSVRVFRVPNTIRWVLQAMNDQIVVWGPRELDENLKAMGPQNSLFPTDAFFARLFPQGPTQLICPFFHPNGQSNLYEVFSGFNLAARTMNLCKPITLAFDGGNMLLGGDFVFAGMDIWVDNRHHAIYGEDFQKFTEAMMHDFGVTEVVWLSSGFRMPPCPPALRNAIGKHQPIYHVDCFVTPMGAHPIPGREGLHYIVLVGEAHWEGGTGQDFTETAHAVAEGLENVVKELTGRTLAGYPVHVLRMPIVFYPYQEYGADTVQMLSYCNCLVECLGSQDKIIYVPHYRFDNASAFEALIELQMEALSFRTHFVHGNYTDMAKYIGGALHCEVNVIGRGAVPDVYIQTPKGSIGIV